MWRVLEVVSHHTEYEVPLGVQFVNVLALAVVKVASDFVARV